MGSYHYIRELGKGGFGKVFLAEEEVSGRKVAIKVLHKASDQAQEAIEHEIHVISQFNSQNIVTYFHNFRENGNLYLVMEYCSGGDLAQYRSFSHEHSNQIIGYIIDVANEMQRVHENNIVHCDIKPSNLLFSEDNTIKITDFGIANQFGGTKPYMAPELFIGIPESSQSDPRVDIYSLGVTLIELLIGRNPFSHLAPEKIHAIHEKGNLPIENLPEWQQEVILKAIHQQPERRFQTMEKFAEALRAKHVPLILKKETVKAGQIAEGAEKQLGYKRWRKTINILNHADKEYPNNVHILRLKGEYYRKCRDMKKALKYFKRAYDLNNRLNIQKQLGEIYLTIGRYPKAISFLSDHIHKYPADLEAYNLLLQSYYETNRYEAGMDLAETVLSEYNKHPCFVNNHYVCNLMQGKGKELVRSEYSNKDYNPFSWYNSGIKWETNRSHNFQKNPTLKSKLLLMDYRFRELKFQYIHILDSNDPNVNQERSSTRIVKIGRKGYDQNNIEISQGTVSRRHCVIIAGYHDVWLVDMSSVGTYLDGQKVDGRSQLVGVHDIKVGDSVLTVSTDPNKLL